MECKFLGQALPMLTQFELIDTLWNVNQKTIELKRYENIELIDTLWNVNILADTLKKGKDVN